MKSEPSNSKSESFRHIIDACWSLKCPKWGLMALYSWVKAIGSPPSQIFLYFSDFTPGRSTEIEIQHFFTFFTVLSQIMRLALNLKDFLTNLPLVKMKKNADFQSLNTNMTLCCEERWLTMRANFFKSCPGKKDDPKTNSSSSLKYWNFRKSEIIAMCIESI